MKKNLIITVLACLIVLLGIGVFDLAYQLKKQTESTEGYKSLSEKNYKLYTEIYKDRDSITHAQQEVKPSSSPEMSISNNYYTYVQDSLAPSLKIAKGKIDELTRINAKLEGELKATREELSENKERSLFFENKYLSIITTEDSTRQNPRLKYSYNAEINVVQFSKRKNIFSKQRNYIDVSSPDKNFKINGLEHFKKEIILRPKRIGVGFQAGYGINENLTISPYLGIGLSYNLIRL